jgi:clan AA aspartic protease (TIGR02281 family)
VKPIPLPLQQFTTSCHSRESFALRNVASKNARAYPPSPVLVWLSLVVILAGNLSITSAASMGMWYDCDVAQGRDHHSDTTLQTQTPLMPQLSEAQLAAVQPGRIGVTEQPGRRGTTEQSGRPGADPDQVARQPMPPGSRLRPLIVEAMLNRQVSVLMMLDTGATYTVLTRQTAQDLGITGLERLPKQPFLTPGGPILSPVTTVKSIRVGTAEAQDVAVAIDTEGHLPIGLLGMTFIRHFKVTMDQVQGQVKFEQR